MRGIRAYTRAVTKWQSLTGFSEREYREVVPTGISTFAWFFEPVLAQLGTYYWLIESYGPFYTYVAEQDDDFQALLELLPSRGEWPPGTVLPEFARYIRNDWATFFGLLARPQSVKQFYRRAHDPQFIEQEPNVAVVFKNVEGVFWEFLGRESHLLDAVLSHLRTREEIHIEETDLVRDHETI